MHLWIINKSDHTDFTDRVRGAGYSALLVVLICSILMLGGCGPLDLGGENTRSATNVTIGQPLKVPGKNNTSGGGDTLVAPGSGSASPTMPNGLPALQPFKGVKVEQLFSENIRDADQRFDRLENAVIDLRREFEVVKPAIVRLVAVESDIQNLVDQLEVMLRNEPGATSPAPQALVQNDLEERDMAPPPAADPQPAPPAASSPPEKTATTQINSSSGVTAKNLRAGIHDTYIRLVIDANRKTPYSYSLDNEENLLIIELPEAQWSGPRQKTLKPLPLLQSYSVDASSNGSGSLIAIVLDKDTRVLKAQALPPGSSNNPNFRIFIDLAK